jgi:exodeoxyribonuclease (lambda-induced)
VIEYHDAQGSAEWLEARRGVITASQFRVCRDRTKKGDYSSAAMLYAMDTARERVGGVAPGVFVNAAMRTGTEQEPFARAAYEARYGVLVDETGFICADDRRFGVSVDGRVGDVGAVEIKTLVSSEAIFSAMVDGDVGKYRDQCLGAMWLLRLRWVDLCLWAPDLSDNPLHVIRINRDEDEIQKLEDDLLAFERLVSQLESKLRAKLYGSAVAA